MDRLDQIVEELRRLVLTTHTKLHLELRTAAAIEALVLWNRLKRTNTKTLATRNALAVIEEQILAGWLPPVESGVELETSQDEPGTEDTAENGD